MAEEYKEFKEYKERGQESESRSQEARCRTRFSGSSGERLRFESLLELLELLGLLGLLELLELLELLLDVFTGVDVEGDDDRLFPGGRCLFQVGQHFESGTGQVGEIVG